MKMVKSFNKNDKFGLLIVISNLGRKTTSKRKNEFKYLCKCECGNEIEVGHSDLQSGNTKSCGCLIKKILLKRNFKHGYAHHPLYTTWRNIITRCYCKTYNCYHRYGGRGIGVFNEWRTNIESFIEYCMKLPDWDKPDYSLDRINNDGDYEPGNIRFITKHAQSMNRSFMPKNKYIGVRIEPGTTKFYSSITVNRQVIVLGWFDTQEEAVVVRNSYILKNNLIEYKTQEVKN